MQASAGEGLLLSPLYRPLSQATTDSETCATPGPQGSRCTALTPVSEPTVSLLSKKSELPPGGLSQRPYPADALNLTPALPRQEDLAQGGAVPLTRAQLASLETHWRGCYWHLLGRGQRCCYRSNHVQLSHHHQEVPGLSVHGPKPWQPAMARRGFGTGPTAGRTAPLPALLLRIPAVGKAWSSRPSAGHWGQGKSGPQEPRRGRPGASGPCAFPSLCRCGGKQKYLGHPGAVARLGSFPLPPTRDTCPDMGRHSSPQSSL